MSLTNARLCLRSPCKTQRWTMENGGWGRMRRLAQIKSSVSWDMDHGRVQKSGSVGGENLHRKNIRGAHKDARGPLSGPLSGGEGVKRLRGTSNARFLLVRFPVSRSDWFTTVIRHRHRHRHQNCSTKQGQAGRESGRVHMFSTCPVATSVCGKWRRVSPY